MLLRAGVYSAIVLFLVAAASVFSWVLVYGKIPQALAASVQQIAKDPTTFLLLVSLALLIIGTVIDGVPGLIMTVPILLPIATEVYGIDPRHFGVVVVVNLVLGLLSPPVGLCFFVAAAVTGANPGRMFVVTAPFLRSPASCCFCFACIRRFHLCFSSKSPFTWRFSCPFLVVMY